MEKPVDIGGGWKAIQVEGGGVIIQAEMGLVAVQWADIGENGNLVNNSQPIPAKPTVVTITPANSITEFLESTNQRDLGADGIYGPLGPTIKKFREVLKTSAPGSALADSAGEFLVTGDHLRFGPVAALVGLGKEQVESLNVALDVNDAVALEKLLDGFLVGNAA